MLHEAQYQTRLHYLAWKRLIVAIEMLLFFVQLFLHLYTYMDPVVRAILVVIGMLRVLTELHNYHIWAAGVNMTDRWLYLWPFQ